MRPYQPGGGVSRGGAQAGSDQRRLAAQESQRKEERLRTASQRRLSRIASRAGAAEQAEEQRARDILAQRRQQNQGYRDYLRRTPAPRSERSGSERGSNRGSERDFSDRGSERGSERGVGSRGRRGAQWDRQQPPEPTPLEFRKPGSHPTGGRSLLSSLDLAGGFGSLAGSIAEEEPPSLEPLQRGHPARPRVGGRPVYSGPQESQPYAQRNKMPPPAAQRVAEKERPGTGDLLRKLQAAVSERLPSKTSVDP
jgi:hypothetical protein